MIVVAIVLVLAVFFVLRFAIVMVPKDHVYVTERMGQYVATLNPGFHFVMPLMDTVRFKYPTTVQTHELSDVLETRDGQRATLTSAYRFRVVDPKRASYEAADYASSLRELVRGSQKRYVAGQTWDALRQDTRSFEAEVKRVVDEVSESIGLKVDDYTVKDLQLQS